MIGNKLIREAVSWRTDVVKFAQHQPALAPAGITGVSNLRLWPMFRYSHVLNIHMMNAAVKKYVNCKSY